MARPSESQMARPLESRKARPLVPRKARPLESRMARPLESQILPALVQESVPWLESRSPLDSAPVLAPRKVQASASHSVRRSAQSSPPQLQDAKILPELERMKVQRLESPIPRALPQCLAPVPDQNSPAGPQIRQKAHSMTVKLVALPRERSAAMAPFHAPSSEQQNQVSEQDSQTVQHRASAQAEPMPYARIFGPNQYSRAQRLQGPVRDCIPWSSPTGLFSDQHLQWNRTEDPQQQRMRSSSIIRRPPKIPAPRRRSSRYQQHQW